MRNYPDYILTQISRKASWKQFRSRMCVYLYFVLEYRYLETRERNLQLFSLFDSDPNVYMCSVCLNSFQFLIPIQKYMCSVCCVGVRSASYPAGKGYSYAHPQLPRGRLVTPALALVTYPCRLVTPAGGICALAA